GNRLGDIGDGSDGFFANPCPVHASVDVDKQSDSASGKRFDAFDALNQRRDLYVRVSEHDFADASGACSHTGIGHQNVSCAGLAGGQQFQGCCAFELGNSAFDEATDDGSNLGGLDVRTPPVRVPAQKLQRGGDVVFYEIEVDGQRRSLNAIGGSDDVRLWFDASTHRRNDIRPGSAVLGAYCARLIPGTGLMRPRK